MGLIFISYSRNDEKFAAQLKLLLEEANFSVWIDKSAIKPGSRWIESVKKGIEESSVVIVLDSPHSQMSENVECEILYAKKKNKIILPVLLNGEPSFLLLNRQHISWDDNLVANIAKSIIKDFSNDSCSKKNKKSNPFSILKSGNDILKNATFEPQTFSFGDKLQSIHFYL